MVEGRNGKVALTATMYFAYGRDARRGVASKTTFEAILAGERTSTTRFPSWPGHARWAALEVGDLVLLHDSRDMKGRSVAVEVTAAPAPIDLRSCSGAELEAWSLAEGWTPEAGRAFGRRHGAGLQVRYALPAAPRP